MNMIVAFLFAGLLAPLTAAQTPELKTLEVFSDNSCQISLRTFTVPAGQTAANFVFSFQTSWQACQGPDRMDWITFGIRGGLSGATLYECTEFFDQRPALENPGPIDGIVAEPGTYVVYLLSGRNSSVRLAYAMSGGAAPAAAETEVKPVVAYRDNGCNLFPGGFQVRPGCTASDFRFRLDSPWMQCSGPERVSEVTFTIRGPAGDVYEYREYYNQQQPPQERLGALSSLVLGSGNYVVLLGSGRDTYLTLNYGLNCPSAPQAAGPGYEPAVLLAEIDTNFTSWYVKRWGSGDESVYRLGTDPQATTNFSWKDVSKDVISNTDITILAPGRIYIDAEFHMEDRPEYNGLTNPYSVGTVYAQIWKNNSWQTHPSLSEPGWQNYVGYAGSREVLPSKGFEYTGQMGGPIQILGTGLAVEPGKFRVSILSAIASDWVVHYPSTGKIYVYFIPD
ncbi:MAG: hypothetical protein NTW38_06925 [Candidatus Aminicenantes bacterium]|nr:hypothetical protein [Candidatus Aminicenantes bacterium]